MNNIKNTKNLNIVTAGVGWVNPDSYGCENKALSCKHEGVNTLYSKLREDSIFLKDIKNFGRFDVPSKLVCAAAALAFYDSGVIYSQGEKRETFGIVGTSENGSLFANEKYFRDYVEGGRELARGNLFIYTLPSSALAEAAICLGLGGPMLYIGTSKAQLESALERAETIIRLKDADSMLAVDFTEEKAVCYYLKKEDCV